MNLKQTKTKFYISVSYKQMYLIQGCKDATWRIVVLLHWLHSTPVLSCTCTLISYLSYGFILEIHLWILYSFCRCYSLSRNFTGLVKTFWLDTVDILAKGATPSIETHSVALDRQNNFTFKHGNTVLEEKKSKNKIKSFTLPEFKLYIHFTIITGFSSPEKRGSLFLTHESSLFQAFAWASPKRTLTLHPSGYIQPTNTWS